MQSFPAFIEDDNVEIYLYVTDEWKGTEYEVAILW